MLLNAMHFETAHKRKMAKWWWKRRAAEEGGAAAQSGRTDAFAVEAIIKEVVLVLFWFKIKSNFRFGDIKVLTVYSFSFGFTP